MPAQILFIPNDHMLVWLPAPEASTDSAMKDLVQQIRSGAWQLPEALREQFDAPDPLRLHATLHAGVIIVRPADAPLRERVSGRPLRLAPEQRQVLHWLGQGMTVEQVALKMRRRQRWVYYRLAEVKRIDWAKNRLQAIRLKHRHPKGR